MPIRGQFSWFLRQVARFRPYNLVSQDISQQHNNSLLKKMSSTALPSLHQHSLFDPSHGITVIEPPGSKQAGCWAGASSVLFDEDSHLFYLTYRLREPRPQRGYIFFVAHSNDGITFENIWQFTREDVDSDSMEKGCLVKVNKDKWYLYISYVSRADNKWKIDVVQASSPSNEDITTRKPVLTSEITQSEGVKDPVVLLISDQFFGSEVKGAHDTGDILNTGLSKASTGLAISGDGLGFSVAGCALTNDDVTSWDWYCTRITAILLNVGGVNIAYYDGAKTVAENYEEKLGISVSLDLAKFHRLSNAPAVLSPFASHSIRYPKKSEFKLRRDGRLFYYYEYAREDGSHELRMNKLKRTCLVDVAIL